MYVGVGVDKFNTSHRFSLDVIDFNSFATSWLDFPFNSLYISDIFIPLMARFNIINYSTLHVLTSVHSCFGKYMHSRYTFPFLVSYATFVHLLLPLGISHATFPCLVSYKFLPLTIFIIIDNTQYIQHLSNRAKLQWIQQPNSKRDFSKMTVH